MKKEKYSHEHNHGGMDKQKHGVSSFCMHDSGVVFDELKIKSGDTFLDLGCGAGDYAIHASKIVGDYGLVYALDRWEEVISGLASKAASQGLNNIKAIVADISSRLPIDSRRIDVCLIATVLHGFDLTSSGITLFNEVRRILKPHGRIAIIECKKEDTPFGPPIHLRLSAKEIEDIVIPCGFSKMRLTNLGYNYMLQFNIK
ncbi:MAG: methyltransferase domain-containing protein [Candidatus Omnitrophota bacterium]|jgi:ubiquinone/menaquinone biosynthesis C-methylase UbiE